MLTSQKGVLNRSLWAVIYLLLGPARKAFETVPVNWTNNWAQYQAEAQIQESTFRHVHTGVIPRSERAFLCASWCCRWQSLPGINSIFPWGAGMRTSPELSWAWPCSPPSHIPDKPGSSSCQDCSLYLYHTRGSSYTAWLLKAEAAFYYSRQSWLCGLQEIRLQDQMLVCVRQCSKRCAREICLCRDRFDPRFSREELHSMLWKPWTTGILTGENYICQI